MTEDPRRYIDVHLANGGTFRVEPVAAHTFHLRASLEGKFPPPTLIRYGLLRNEWPRAECSTEDTEGTTLVRAGEASLLVSKADGQVTLFDELGNVLTGNAESPKAEPEGGFAAAFRLEEGERLYGLGDVDRERLQRRGSKVSMWVQNVIAYAPIPFVMSSRGWALCVNTTWKHHLDLGCTRHDQLRCWARHGELDYYLIAGKDYATLLDRYTDLVGKPCLLPLWGYGLTYVCHTQATAREMLEDCRDFRREGIPCDLIGLEPGWMEKFYDFSVEKQWHPDRFMIPTWARKESTFLGAAASLGFKLSLWLCSEYDLSYEEERRDLMLVGGKPPLSVVVE